MFSRWFDEELGMRFCDWILKIFIYFFIYDVIIKYNNIVILEFCYIFEKLCRFMFYLKVDKMLCYGFIVENVYFVNILEFVSFFIFLLLELDINL